MEKKRLLGPALRAIILICVVLVAGGCSLPRIAVLHDPLTPEEHVNLGVSYEKRGESDAALTEYKKAAKELPIANLYVGNVYFAQKKFIEATKSYKKAIAKADSPEARNNLAWLYFVTNTKLDDAERLAEEAVKLSPQSEGFSDTLEQIRAKRIADPSPQRP
jgi:tetratricopeptide (TPR) repeat protein